jgi:hypothetical protein
MVTGLKYLGKTSRNNPYKYSGSGVFWKNHINKHGHDIETDILLATEDEQELIETGIFFSKLFNVVESDEWANLKPETGDGGWIKHSKQTREQIRHVKIEKYGTNYMDMLVSEKANSKRTNTCLERYGVENTALSEEIREKQISTCLEKYGATSPFGSEQIRQKARDTIFERYGVHHAAAIPSSKEKIKKSWELRKNSPTYTKTKCINDGINCIRIPINQTIPIGWKLGVLRSSRIWINNGIIETTVDPGETLVPGWKHGRTKKKFVNNGIETLLIGATDNIPEGYMLGRTAFNKK